MDAPSEIEIDKGRREIQRLRRQYVTSVAIFLGVVALAAFLTNESLVSRAVWWVGLPLSLMVMVACGARCTSIVCPRCGKPFGSYSDDATDFEPKEGFNHFTSTCLHCGLTLSNNHAATDQL